jgi:hypothetical protein
MNANQIHQSIENETRLMRVMIMTDVAGNECRSLAASGYDPETMEKYEEVLRNMGTSLVHRINHERESRSQSQEEQSKKPAIIIPFSRNKSPNGQ